MDDYKVRIKNIRAIIEDIQKRRQSFEPDSPQIKLALTRIALLVTNQAKMNIRRQGLIDTGSLLNSLRYEFYRSGDTQGVLIGSFNIPYAAIWEFGYHGVQRVRTHSRLITQAFGRPLKAAKLAQIRAHGRNVNVQARPYLRPAYQKHREKISQILLQSIQEQ